MKILAFTLKSLLLSLALGTTLGTTAFAAETVDINTADAAMLAERLDGIGLAKAQAIVEYRQNHGPFQSADQLVSVKGIGLATVEKNRDRIQIGSQQTQQQAPEQAPAR